MLFELAVNMLGDGIREFGLLEIQLTIENLKNHKALRLDNIPSELIQAGGGKLYEKIYKLIVLI